MDTTTKIRSCRICVCTDLDCSQCIKKTGEPCGWVEKDLCSACQPGTIKKVDQDLKSFNEMLRRSGLKVFIGDPVPGHGIKDICFSARPFVESIRNAIKKGAVEELIIGKHKWKPL